MKEYCENVKLLLEKIQNKKYLWKVYGALKIIALLAGLELGYRKLC
jgi:hypothetical protein